MVSNLRAMASNLLFCSIVFRAPETPVASGWYRKVDRGAVLISDSTGAEQKREEEEEKVVAKFGQTKPILATCQKRVDEVVLLGNLLF